MFFNWLIVPNLGKLRYAGDEDELQIVIKILQRTEQVPEARLDGLGHLLVADAVKHLLVVFIHKQHYTMPCLLMSCAHKGFQP